MKNTLLFLMLLLTGMAGAQIVNIPDEDFKAWLLESSPSNNIAKNSAGASVAIDANGDGQIQVSEAQAIWQLFVTEDSGFIESMEGIAAFSNVRTLDIYHMALTELDVTALSNLQTLSFDFVDYMEQLNIQNLANLQSLSIGDGSFNHIQALDFSGVNSLKYLKLAECPYLVVSNFENLTELETLIITAGDHMDITITGMPDLKFLTLDETDLAIVDFTQLPSLEIVDVELSYDAEIVDLSVCQNLQSLKLECNSAAPIILGEKPFLTFINIQTSSSSLNLSGCTAVTKLGISMGNMGAGSTRYLNLKNGVSSYEQLNLYLTAESVSPLYVCIDEGNQSLIPATALANPYIQVSTYCSFTPGGDYNTIAGNFTFDSDNNGCDGNDGYTGFVKLNIDNGIEELSTFTTSGHYNFYTQAGTYTLTPQLENDWFTITPATATITQATVDNSTTTQNFCIAANGVHPDVEVIVTPLWNAAPGFDADYKIVYRNKGNQTLSGTITLNYDDSVLDYVEAYPAVTSSVTGLLTWNYANLLPFETRSILVNMNLNGPMEIPAVNIDDVLAFSVSVTPTTGDETPADNTFTLNQIVTGSFDPNDIICLEGRSVSPDKIGEYLHYNINFENTGTAPATFIVVKNMIDQTKFDISTLQLMDASHAIETRINGNKVEFIFDNINLGPEEKGNVTFKIKTKNTLQVNDDVTQQADIFFDYNWPIQTNEATTTFEVLSRSNFAMDNSVKVYPNPAKGIVTVSAGSNVKSIQLYDMQGRLLQSGTVNDIHTTIDLSSRTSGMYFVKVFTDKGIKVEKVAKE